jgi:alpha-amylase/alpha-mannosidase (GH57 family)
MKYICIHGHFYQPPRENPDTGKIDIQDSAKPYPNWNFRINSECYQANTNSPIIGEDGAVIERKNNYSSISFNFGPTLLRWMEEYDVKTHDAIVEADRSSIETFGHGTALAQVYHHPILPLCNTRDKVTEVQWGIADFQHRFGRFPDGIWLSETAVDISTLEVLAELGLQFTLLAPKQVREIALVGSEEWRQVDENSLDTTKPYLVELPSGKSISVFFYHGELAHSVAFSGALDNGEGFAHQIREVAQKYGSNALIHFATDGESYGHHHRYGDMALAYCLKTMEGFKELKLCNYATYLNIYPPQYKVHLQDVSAWSCAHGVGRWSENCGCVIDNQNQGKQEWRSVLRDSLNWLRDELALLFQYSLSSYVKDPWYIRDHWQRACLEKTTVQLIESNSNRKLTVKELDEITSWMEIQRHCLMMFTSCGWFFDDPAGLECVQILRYAKRALAMLDEVHKKKLEAEFVNKLATMKSVSTATPCGNEIWQKLVCNE